MKDPFYISIAVLLLMLVLLAFVLLNRIGQRKFVGKLTRGYRKPMRRKGKEKGLHEEKS